MDTRSLNVKEMNQSELNNTNGGLVGIIAGVIAASIAATTAYGYYKGKQDCPPPPCTE